MKNAIKIGTKTKKTVKDIKSILKTVKECEFNNDVAVEALDTYRDISKPEHITIQDCNFEVR